MPDHRTPRGEKSSYEKGGKRTDNIYIPRTPRHAKPTKTSKLAELIKWMTR